MEKARYDRLYRTASSESYLLSDGEEPFARVELHFGQQVVHGLLVFEREPTPEAIVETLARIDEEVVATAGVARDDLVVTVYVGRELGVFDDAGRGRGIVRASATGSGPPGGLGAG